MATAEQLLDEELALEHELALERARTSLLGFVTATNDAYEVNWHHRRICTAIDALYRGWTHRQLLEAFSIHGDKLRRQLDEPHPTTGLFAGLTHPSAIDAQLRSLHIAVPPRMGKSTLASMAMPAWWFGKDPNAQIISTSYSADLASRINRQVQREIDNARYTAIFPETRLNAKNVKTVAQNSYLRNSDLFEIVDHKGVYRSAGVAGGVTGMGASCFVAGTTIQTEFGSIPIEKLVAMSPMPRVWGYSHVENTQKLCKIEAVRQTTSAKLVQIEVDGRHAFTCTSEHLVWTGGKSYWSAALLGPEEDLQRFRQSAQQNTTSGVQDLQRRRWARRNYLPTMLSRHAAQRMRAAVYSLQIVKNCCDGRISQTLSAKLRSILLLKTLFVQGQQSAAPSTLPSMRGKLCAKSKNLVFRFLSRVVAISCKAFKKSRLQVVWENIQPAKQRISLLRYAVQECSSFCSNDRKSQSLLPSWQIAGVCIPQNLQKNPTIHLAAGPSALSILRQVCARARCSHTSYRRKRDEQRDGQPHYNVRELSRRQAQTFRAQVKVIATGNQTPRCVYDIQVAECHNYYANEILVHNCAIIDDPVKNRDQADSQVVREGVWEWYASTLYTRLHRGAVKLLIQTRWHEDDLGGRVLAQAKSDQFSDQWFGLIYPAILDAEPTPGDPRNQGEAMWPSHFPLEQMKITRATIGTYEFEALYQQRPAPREGGIIKTSWLRYYTRLPDDLTSYTMSADLTFGSRTTSKGDFVAIQMWACAGADRYLIDQIHARMEFTDQIRALKTMSGKYPMCRLKLIEDAANGRAAISVLRTEVQGLVPVRALGSKQARLQAVSPQIESGNVYLPAPAIAPWVQANVHELASFPNGAHDDTIDAMVYALDRLSPNKQAYRGILPVSLTKTSQFGLHR